MKKWIFISIGLVVVLSLIAWLVQQKPGQAIAFYHLFSMEEPPFWLQRIEQRQEVRARVQAAGGWDAVRRECLQLWQTNQDGGMVWNKFQTNQPALPPALAALRPMFVNATSPGIIDITLYGMGETGHRGQAGYGLWVFCDVSTNLAEPRRYPNCTYHKLSDNVYEYY